jgi:hypothetical protein
MGAGLGLLALPDVAVKLLLGADISGASVPLGRVAGVALLALGLACCLARDHAVSALTSAMLLYNCGVAAVLGMAGVVSGMTGVLLWPAVVLHAVMAVWSFMMRREHLGSASI